MVLFAMTATVTVYVSSDIIILGFICGDWTTGIYSVSAKIYSIIKTVLSSAIVVSVPRLSLLLGQNKMDEFSKVANDVYNTLISLVLPTLTGIIVLRTEIISVVFGATYLSATSSLVILCFALFFCLGAWFWGQSILVPTKREGLVFRITVISALINIILNFILIPIWQEKAAALTTMISEGFSFVLCLRYGKRSVKSGASFTTLIKSAIGCAGIIGIALAFRGLIHSLVLRTLATVITSIVAYGLIEILLNNDAVIGFVGLANRFSRNRKEPE